MSSFQIPEGPNQISVSPGQPGNEVAAFTVNSKVPNAVRASLKIQVSGGAKAEWFAIEGEPERAIPGGASEAVAVRVNVPAGVAPGDYRFRLRAVAVNDPDNDFAEGPPVTLIVKPTDGTSKPPYWLYLLIALLVLAALGVGAYFWLKPDKPKPAPSPAPTVTPAPTPVAATMPDLVAANIREAEARARLAAIDATLDIETRPVERSDVPPMTVVAQAPAAGQPLARGAPIRISVAYPWFFGTWTGTLDGRPSTMRWRLEGDAIAGDFSDGSTGRYVPLAHESHNGEQLFFRHPDGNHWFLARSSEGEARGYSIWQGRQFPLIMSRRSLAVEQ